MLAKASPSLMDAVILFCCGGFTEEDKMQEVRTQGLALAGRGGEEGGDIRPRSTPLV